MSFAPVLDPSASSVRPELSHKATRAAGFALRRLAATNEQLLLALTVVDKTEPDSRTSELSLKFAKIIAEVSEATGTSQSDILESVVEQLRQVVEFANLDGGQLDANVGAVGNLIRSGRVELFAG